MSFGALFGAFAALFPQLSLNNPILVRPRGFFAQLDFGASPLLANPLLARLAGSSGFIADATIEEHHTDELVITDHPVEQTAAISDHAYKRPVRVTVQAGFSNSSLQALGNPVFDQLMYQNFLSLQASCVPFDILTGKRAYTNMLIERLTTTTDERTENALILLVDCREVILVSTQTVQVPSSVQKFPQLNQPTQNGGQNALVPGTNFNQAAAP